MQKKVILWKKIDAIPAAQLAEAEEDIEQNIDK